MIKNEKYKKAKKQVGEIKDFYIHATVYVFVNSLLFIINILSSRENLWFYWPLFGWGIGLFAHWISVFGIHGFLDKEWEEHKIREIMKKN